MTSKNGKTAAVNGRQFTHEPSGTTFTLPEPVSVATQLRYYSALGFLAKKEESYIRAWDAARTIIQNWNSELLPDLDTDLETITDNRAVWLIMWSGNQVASYLAEQDTVEKNS